jgi:NAD(P)-dependent dehydrogenase (short-subunit alcohol dehydrogenase family)
MRFDDRTVVLTGVGREGQVGEVVARTFAERGAAVAAIDRIQDELEARVADLRAGGHRATAHVCDLTDEAQLRAVADDIAKLSKGRVAALVNLAGGFAMSGPVSESDPSVWQRQLAINLTTAYLTTRAFLPLVRAARGSIVFFASAAALPGSKPKEMSAYAAAKSGVLTLMRAVAEEERAHGVRANAVAPTSIRTASNLASMGESTRYVEREEVAEVVTWLCSDGAKAVSGQVIAL